MNATSLDGALRRKTRNRAATRREYKLMLNAGAVRADADAGFPALRALLERTIAQSGVATEGIEAQFDVQERRTWYLDTPGRTFRGHGLSLRVREEAPGDEAPHRVTLRARSTDRLVAASYDLRTPADGRRRFEEEYLPWPAGPDGSAVVFSYACTVKPAGAFAPVEVGTAAALFPVLGRLGGRDERRLTIVRGFVAHETAHWLCRAKLGDGLEARFWVADWRPATGAALMTAELSFEVELGDGDAELVPRAALTACRATFGALQADLDERAWLDRRSSTKTDFAYERARVRRGRGAEPEAGEES